METLMLDLVHAHLDAYSTSDWRKLGAVLSPDVVYDDVGNRQRIIGVAGYLAIAQRWKRAFPDLRATVQRSFSVGNSAMIELIWSGRHLGPFDMASMTVAATRREVSLRSGVFYAVSGRQIREARHYYDMLSVLSQLGQSTFETPRRTAERRSTDLFIASRR
jgi:steroid delta-isomerase-like uncharacterized protein